MSGGDLCIFSTSTASWPCCARGSNVSFDPGGSQDWHDLLSNIQKWRNNKLYKVSARNPSLKHCLQREPIRPNNQTRVNFVQSTSVAQHEEEALEICLSLECLEPGNQKQEVSGSSECLEADDIFKSLCEENQLDKALNILSLITHHGIIPSENMYWTFLRACIKSKSSHQVKQVHLHLAFHGLDSISFLGEFLVNSMVKCGDFEVARRVFLALPYRTVFSWTAVISGCTDNEKGQEALKLYKCMRDEGVEPNEYTFVSLLKACGSMLSLEEGKALHVEAQKKGFDSNVFVCSTLVSMFGKCGNIVEAEIVFGGLSEHNIVVWNAMLSAYAEQGQPDKALGLYRQMGEEGVSEDERTFVSTLQACCTLAEKEEAVVIDGRPVKVVSLNIGRALHAVAHRKGLDSNVFVGSALVSMYGKCGNISEAENVFTGLSHCNVVSWNSMLSVCAEQGEGEKALQLHKQMQDEGVSPNERTFVATLQACCTLVEKEKAIVVEGQLTKVMSLEIGRALHTDAQRNAFNSNVFVGSILMSLYGKCGSIVDVEIVFDVLSQHNVVSWNAMLSAYVEHSRGEKALQLYKKMQEEGVNPNERTIVIALQACCLLAEQEDTINVEGKGTKVISLDIGMALHADARRKDLDSDVFVNSSLINMYGRCRSIACVQYVFGRFPQHNVVSWTAMLSAYVEQGEGNKALCLFRKMQDEGVNPNEQTFAMALQACLAIADTEEAAVVDGRLIKAMSLEIGQALHIDAKRKGFDSDVFVGSTLVIMYGKCGSLASAQNVFDGLTQRNVVSWTAMLSAYVEQGQGQNALALYAEMGQENVVLDDTILVCILQACSETGQVDICRQVHFMTASDGYNLTLFLANTLIHTYGSCAHMPDAQAVFDVLPLPDVVSWTALIAGYAREGNHLASLQKFEEMELAGIMPNRVTFLSLLSACSHAGLVDKGFQYFESMSKEFGVSPKTEHFVSVVDLLARVGDFMRVNDLVMRLPMQPDGAMWSCLLGACQKHGNMEMGRKVFDGALCLEPEHTAAYILMSNIYANETLYGCMYELDNLKSKSCREEAWREVA